MVCLPTMAGMKQIAFILMLFVVVLSPLAAVCQGSARKSDWAVVQTQARGEALEVRWTGGPSYYCIFAGATDDALFCGSHPASGGGDYSIARTAVREIRHAKKMPTTSQAVGISVAAGVVAGAAMRPQPGGSRAVDAVYGGLGGIMVGAVASAVIAIPAAFIPGKLIYRQAKAAEAARDAQSSGRAASTASARDHDQ